MITNLIQYIDDNIVFRDHMPLRRLIHMRTTTGHHQHSPMIPQTATFWNVVIAQERHWSEHVNYVPMKNRKLTTRAKIAQKKPKNISIHLNINLPIQLNHIQFETTRLN